MPQESLIVSQGGNRGFDCVREGDSEPCVVGIGSSVLEAVGDWAIYSHVVKIKSYPPAYPNLRECINCQKPITAKADTTDKKFYCAACIAERDIVSKRHYMAEERAEQLFPEMLHSKAGLTNRLTGFRIDLSFATDTYERYIVTSVVDNDDIAWIWVFDDESKTAVKKKVQATPKAIRYFDREIAATGACILELNPEG